MTDYDFTTVSTGEVTPETKIVFDTIDDSFTGKYLGMRDVPNPEGTYQQARFQDGEDIYFTNANHSLRDGLKNVRIGSIVRITYVDDLDTGQANTMRLYKVEVARGKGVSKAS